MCLFDYGNHANSGELQNRQSGGYDHNAERICRFLSAMFITIKTQLFVLTVINVPLSNITQRDGSHKKKMCRFHYYCCSFMFAVTNVM